MAKSSLRDKFKATSTATLKKLKAEEDKLLNYGNQNGYLTLEPGDNKIRFMPKHEGEEDFKLLMSRAWVEVPDEETGKNKRRPVLNAKVHGGFKRDVIEEYNEFVQNNLDEDDPETAGKLKIVNDWKTGLNFGSSWLSYAAKVIKGSKDLKIELFEMKKILRDAINDESIIEDEEEAISADPFTGPDDGLPVTVTYNKDTKDARQRYKVRVSKVALPLSDETLEELEKLKPLSKLDMVKYSEKDFETALEGLKVFDEENEIGLFDSDEFQAIIEEIRDEISAGAKKSSKKDTPAKSSKKSSKKVEEDDEDEEAEETEEESDEEEEESTEGDEYDEMDRAQLKKELKKSNPDFTVLKKHTDDDLRAELRKLAESDEEEAEEEEQEEEEAEEVPETKPATKKPATKGKLSLADVKAKLKNRKK